MRFFAAGTVPFKSDSILGLYNEICKTPLTFPEHIFVSDSMKHLLLRLLDKDPENRISLTSAMCHQWVTHNDAYPLQNIQVRHFHAPALWLASPLSPRLHLL